MESIIYGKPILHSVITLKALIANFKDYTKEQVLSDDPQLQYEECLKAVDLIKGSIDQINTAMTKLQSLIDKMKTDYDNTKNKDDKKSILTEMEAIEKETNFTEVMSEATDLSFMLTTRLTEAKSNEKRIARRLAIHEQSFLEDDDRQNPENEPNRGQDVHLHRNFQTRNNIPIPQISLPKFYGADEEFPEFWAAFKTLVHDNSALSTIEKMLFLKDSLKGKSDRSIQGIQLVPENYEWMIQVLTKKYGNKLASRARIVQQLNDLQRADGSAESSELVYDKICSLLNQMTSSGQNIRPTSDAMWTEIILSKFPQEIIQPVLMKTRGQEEITVETVLEMIQDEIATKAYVQARIQPDHVKRKESENKNSSQIQICAICERRGHFAWQCRSAITVTERRKIMLQKRLCWKCYSNLHQSSQCNRDDCPLCGKMHHIKLCYANENTNNNAQPTRNYPRQTVSPPVTRSLQHEYKPNHQIPDKKANGVQKFSPSGSKNQNLSSHIKCSIEDTQEKINEQLTTYKKEQAEMHANVENNSIRNTEQIVLMTAEGSIWNYNTKHFENAVFFFDTGAQKTIIQEEFAYKLGLPRLKTETCIMSGIGGHTETFSTNVVHLRIGTAYGKDLEILIQTKPILTNGFPAVKLSTCDQEYLQKRNIRLSNPCIRGEKQMPQILVGLDYYYNFILDDGDTCQIPSGLRMANTIFGPTIYGRGTTDSPNSSTVDFTTVSYNMTAVEETEKELLKKLFELEGMGISSEESHESSDFIAYFKTYSKQISFNEGYLTAPFPLKPNVEELADNYSTAIRRLISLHRQLEINPTQKEWYCKILQQYEIDDIIEPASGEASDSVGLYYMPHSGVWRPHKPRPLRIVFDASSKRKGELSLNDVTLKGEALVNKIHDILVASRKKKIIMICDIEAAFTQIRLQNNHKDLCRFLWFKNPDMPPTRDNIVEYRFKRVPFGAKPSPSILNMCLLSFLQSKNTSLSKEIVDNLYVDNILLCAESPSEAIEKYHESKTLFAEIGMNLREYVSNCEEVNNSIPKHDRGPNGIIKILGVEYNTVSDDFYIRLTFGQKSTLTKKDIVSQLNSIYDPIGIANPLTVRLKHLMREIYDTGIGWKDTIPEHLLKKWTEACEEFNNTSISLPRHAFHECSEQSETKSTLWVFADASSKALAACAFFRHENPISITLLISGKTRLTPKKNRQTIPRLETLAILMAVRLAKNIVTTCEQLVKQVNILSDSEIALAWMNSTRDLPMFVENQKHRITREKNVIESKGVPVQFYHVPTDKNPADAGTRGISVSQLQGLPWIHGPQWLKQELIPPCLRSMSEINIDEPSDDEITTTDFISEFHTSSANADLETQWIPLPRFSRFSAVIRTVARIGKILIRWVNKTNRKLEPSQQIVLTNINKFSPNLEISAEDFSYSETIILRETHKNISLKDLSKRFPQKSIFRDNDGVIRNRSRLQNAAITYDTKNPIFVEKDSDLARLILNDIHVKNAHCGKDHTLCIAKQRFWIPRPATAFKKFVNKCVICKKYQGLPLGAPEMPSLPKDRVILTKPFENVGCDFMGPFTCKENQKYYICLYTCLTTRAIHLEVVEDMSAETFLNSFIRFVSRRGVPSIIRTDCGTNFKLGQRVIESMHDSSNYSGSVMSYSANNKIQWIFNPPGAPWMGGAWERMVGTVKRSLTKSIGRRKLTYSELYTIVTEIEAIVNTRPLTKYSPNIDELPIRPVDFLQNNLKYAILSSKDNEEEKDPNFDPNLIQSVSQVRQALEHVERVTQKFWERWHVEYLTELREIQMRYRKQARHSKLREPKVGEIVLVEQENIPRGSWCYGKVHEVVKSSDGLSRSVKLIMPNKHIWHRPITKIYPLEIYSAPDEEDSSSSTHLKFPPHGSEAAANKTEERPKALPGREAKHRAIKAIQENLEALNDEDTSHIHSTSCTQATAVNSTLITIITVIALLLHSTVALPTLLCQNDSLRVLPPEQKFELCIRSTCKSFPHTTHALTFKLPSSIKANAIPVVLRYTSDTTLKEIKASCVPPNVCDVSQTLLSKRLIGNPHCWPIGAFISITIAIHCIILLLLLIIKASKRQKHHRPNMSQNRQTNAPNTFREHIRLHTFSPSRLNSATILAILVLSTVFTADTCQFGYTRHTTELICGSKGNCSLHFYREIMFNDIMNLICINILHKNKTVGTIEVEKLPTELSCSKHILFFTRDTDHKTFSITRCSQMGSCINDMCSLITEDSQIAELGNASQYPGYSGCVHSCGGLSCGCLLPFPSCSFYRIAHIPRTEEVYEIVRCMEWEPMARLKIRITIMNKSTYKTLAIRPYVNQEVEGISFSIISLGRPTYPLLSSRFAIADKETLIVPEEFNIPVECPNHKIAATEFALCKNKMVCNCDVQISATRCNCPKYSINSIKMDTSKILPVSTPFLRFITRNHSIVALSSKEEMTISIESTSIRETAEFVVKQKCIISLSTLTGCYGCQEGASVNLSCLTEIPSWVIVQCDTHVFSIECSPNNSTTTINLDLSRAVINETCHTECNDNLVVMHLQGTLEYLPHINDEQIFETHDDPWKANIDWLHDWKFPDLQPIINTTKKHWKAALVVFSSITLVGAAAYLLGPAAVVMILRTTSQCAILLTKTLLSLASAMLALCVKTLNCLCRLCPTRNSN